MIDTYYAVSIAGPSHIDCGEPCQDSCHVVKKENASFAAVTDGVGSQKYSQFASSIAAEDAVEICAEGYHEGMGDEDVFLLMKQAFKDAYSNILKYAADNGAVNGEGYDTTLCLAIYNGEKLWYGQAGDSGLVALLGNGEYKAITKQQRGRDGGVYPLASGEAVWHFGVVNEPVYSLLLCTDGVLEQIQPPVLEGGLNIALCEKLMHPSREWSVEDYEKAVYRFLEGYPRGHLDDDKTAVLLINSGVEPVRKDEEYYLPPDWKAAYAKARASISADNEPAETEVLEEHVVSEPVEKSDEDLEPEGCTENAAQYRAEKRKTSLSIIAAAVWIGAIVFGTSAAFVISMQTIGSTQPTYFGLFRAVCAANASVLVPVPTFRLIMGMSHLMNPGAVALVAAFASTCSEVYAYLVGECAAKFMSRRQRFMLKVEFPGHLYVTAFILGATPLPLLDLYLVWAGAVGADEAKLVPAIFLGRLCKMLFFVIVASFISPVI